MSPSFLSLRGVSKRFLGLLAVDDVSLDVAAGELVSTIGPNGAGKTMLFNLLTGQVSPSAGRVVFASTDTNGQLPQARVRLGFGRTFQISQTLASLTVLENA